MRRAIVMSVPWLLLAGCGTGNGDGKPTGPTDETGDTPSVTDSASTTDTGEITGGPVTATIDPPDGYVDVAPRPGATVVFSRPVDGLSLQNATLEVLDGLGRPLDASPLLEPDGVTVTIDLIRPFDFTDTVSVSLSGVQTSDGATAPEVTATWQIQPQPDYAQYVDHDADLGWVYTHDAGGNRLTVDRFATGPDRRFPSGDDVQEWRAVATRFPNGRADLVEIYEDPGTDGSWATPDDVLSSVQDIEASGLEETQTDVEVGPDAIYGTQDDTITFRQRTEYDKDYNVLRYVQTTGAGPNGIWFDADDAELLFVAVDRDKDGQVLEIRRYRSAGVNGLLFDTDDVVDAYERSTYNADKRVENIRGYNGPGTDGDWFTNDDVVLGHIRVLYNGFGQVSQRYTLDDYGPDLVWFSQDDTGVLHKYAYAATQVLTREIEHSDYGKDGRWNNQDDTIAFYDEIDFDDQGFYTSGTSHDDPGFGGMWFDNDDPTVQEWIHIAPRAASDPEQAVSLGRRRASARVRTAESFFRLLQPGTLVIDR